MMILARNSPLIRGPKPLLHLQVRVLVNRGAHEAYTTRPLGPKDGGTRHCSICLIPFGTKGGGHTNAAPLYVAFPPYAAAKTP
jgi:hypothetical protein